MSPGDTVEWDITYNGKTIGTRIGTIIAVDYWHLVVKVDKPENQRYATPFMLCGMGDVRLVKEEML